MKQFDHERLDVYGASIGFVVLANELVERLPRGRAYLTNQLQRAATSILLNIAEGSGEFSAAEKARFYRMAKRSATECAAILAARRKTVQRPAGPWRPISALHRTHRIHRYAASCVP